MNRQCSRSGCAEAATATLSYGYEWAVVWLDDLASERSPHDYDLCAGHSGRLSVPRGWQLEDRRSTPVLALRAPRMAG